MMKILANNILVGHWFSIVKNSLSQVIIINIFIEEKPNQKRKVE